MFAAIEKILNSKPLCQSSGHVLTPAHFLTGSNLLVPSMIPEEVQPKTLGQRFRLQQKVINAFWKIWSKDYLNQLRNSNKWKETKYNLVPGDVVLIKEESLSVCIWPMSVVEKVYIGSIKRRNVNSLVLLISGDAAHPHRGSMLSIKRSK